MKLFSGPDFCGSRASEIGGFISGHSLANNAAPCLLREQRYWAQDVYISVYVHLCIVLPWTVSKGV